MEDAYIGTVFPWAGNYAPRGWAFCDGSILSIQEQTTLFAVIGNIYGGDGYTNFALPNLKGRAAVGSGYGPGLNPKIPGQIGGYERVTLNESQIPAHYHGSSGSIKGKEEADNGDPSGNYIAGNGSTIFGSSADLNMNPSSVEVNIEPSGGNNGHDNMPPYLAINYIICLDGVFPSRY
jgi:microcystin-dependent protein